MQSEEKLSPSYTGDKKHLCPRKHSLEVTQEEVQDEELRTGEREYTILQSVEETSCEPVAVPRVRPVEQGCLKRPMSRKMGRQESIEELDKEKLKSKMVVKRQDWSERRESLQKQDALWESDSSPLCVDDRDEGFVVRGQNKPQSSPECGPLEAKAASATLKDVLYKKLTTRASEGITEPSGGSSECEGGLRSTLCSIHPERQHSRQAKDNMKPDRLDFKAPKIEFTRKRLSFEEREDCICRLSPGIHENLHFGSTRSKSLQLDTAMSHDHMKVGLGSVHSSPEGLAPKIFSGRGESAVEKLQLISSADSPLRKTSSEYKLEGRHVSSLKPLEGTLDIGLLSGPRVPKSETSLSKTPENTSDTVSVAPPIWLQSPTEKQITIPGLKTTDKPKSPVACSPNREALNSTVISEDQSNNAATEVKINTSDEKTQDRQSDSLKSPASKVEASVFTVKQESRTGMKVSSALAHEHRGPRHSSHFSSCGKTPSIREVSNEDQEDEVEQQEVTPQTISQNTDSPKTVVSLTSTKLEVEKIPPAPTQVVTLATDASEPSPVSLRQSMKASVDTSPLQSCEKKTATAQNSNMACVPAVNVQNISASVHVPEKVLSKQQQPNVCSSNTESHVSITASASGETCHLKSSVGGVGTDRRQTDGSAVKVISDTGDKTENNSSTAGKVEQKRQIQIQSLKKETGATQGLNKKDNAVSTVESNRKSVQKQEDPISPNQKNKSSVKDSEQLSKQCSAEKAQQKLSAVDYCTSKKEETVWVQENTVVPSEKRSASATANEHVSPKSNSRPDPQPVTTTSVKPEKETRTLEVKSHCNSTPLVPVVKGSPNVKQSKESLPSTSNIHVTRDANQKESSSPSSGVDGKLERSVQLTHRPAPANGKQRETQPKSSVATTTHTVKENTQDSKPKSPPPKTVPSSSTLKTSSVAPAPAVKQSLDAKQTSPKNQVPVIKDHHDSKPKDVASPLTTSQHHLQHHKKEPLPSSHAPSQPAPPPVLPKPALKKEPLNSGAVSARVSTSAPHEAVVKAPMDVPKSEVPTPDSRKSPDTRINSPDKQAASSRKEQTEKKRKETVQEATSAQKSTKRDSPRAAPPAPKDSSGKETGRCKQQKESPRSSSNKK